MPDDAERMKRLVEFKRKLENKIEELNSDLKDSQAMLETVNSLLVEKGFKHLKISEESIREETSLPEKQPKEAESIASFPPSMREPGNSTPLQTATGELLADLYVEGDSLRVVLAEDKNFHINTPPFTQFFVERILQKMQDRDSELVRAGQLSPEDVLCYNISREGDMIREISVRNIDPDRLRELKSSVRWTLEKMYEKMKSQT